MIELNLKYDVIVIGAGHAGCEAAAVAARMQCNTLLVTMNMDQIALMPCNPAVGGPGKAHLVRELDALGGLMAKIADKSSIQMRELNTAKGPAVRAYRAQIDKRLYQNLMLRELVSIKNLDIVQGMVDDLLVANGAVEGIITNNGTIYYGKTVVITTGTYLKGKIITGSNSYTGGPSNQLVPITLSEKIKKLGIRLGRFKTGTPPRLDARSLDYSKMEKQNGDSRKLNFSFWSDTGINGHNLPCWLTYTNQKTHAIINNNLHRSPLYSGMIEGIGPRYCPSIEDKVVRFKNREKHQLFVEPEGVNTHEMYLQGLSTSLPEDVQREILRSIPGLENAVIVRYGYAIEYDYIVPDQLNLTLAIKAIRGLFSAGQINGTSGYEEAAAQGIIAGINAALLCKNGDHFIVRRSEGYLGVLIDDLVNKGVEEPYRILTSRAEYRLLLRQDNADERLTEKGYQLGSIDQNQYERWLAKKEVIEKEFNWLKITTISPDDQKAIDILLKKGSSLIKQKTKIIDILSRPEITYQDIMEMTEKRNIQPEIATQVETRVKYEGYIANQMAQVKKFEKLEARIIDSKIEYGEIDTLSIEAKEKLTKIKPISLGQASRIVGVTPADLNVLMVYLERRRRAQKNDN